MQLLEVSGAVRRL